MHITRITTILITLVLISLGTNGIAKAGLPAYGNMSSAGLRILNGGNSAIAGSMTGAAGATVDLFRSSAQPVVLSSIVSVQVQNTDNSTPATTASIQSNINVPQTITLTCNDVTGSGCAAIYYCLGNGCTPTTIYNHPIPVSSLPLSTVVNYFSVDSAGNIENINSGTITQIALVSVPRYSISTIPPATVWPGNPAAFYVYSATLGASASLSYQLNGSSPQGSISFDPVTGLFRYTPNPADKQPFSVTFTASLGTDKDAQEVQITPIPTLPAEQEVFGFTPDPTKLPNPEDKSFIVNTKVQNSVAEPFNNRTINTLSVNIAGKRLVFEKGNALYDSYNNLDNIKEMQIFAETVVVRCALHLPQTNVTIHTRDLRFEDAATCTEKASLSTTPISNTTLPPETLNGQPGLRGGDINLHIQTYYADPGTDARFVLHGGNGQPAGLGRAPATAPGIPGKGGIGGNITSNIPLVAQSADITGGSPGLKAQNVTGGSSVIYALSSVTGDNGNIITTGNVWDWLHPYALKMNLAFIKDNYLHGDLAGTNTIIEEYLWHLQDYKTAPEWSDVSDTVQLELDQISGEMQVIQHRIASNLDYFGNPAGWVPMLAFEVNKAAYDNEIDKAIRLWYLTYWLTNKSATLQQKIDAMVSGRTQLQAEIQQYKTSFNETMTLIPKLEFDIEDITAKAEAISVQLVSLDQQLQARAQANVNDRHKAPFWKKACGVIGTVCQLIPAYQPVLGAVGTGLKTISTMDSNKPLSAIMSTAKTITSKEFKKEFNDYEANCGDLYMDVSDVASDFNVDTVKAYSSSISKRLGPVLDHLKKYKDIVQNTQAPKSEIEQELAKLRASDPLFNELTKKVEELNARKEEFVRELQTAQQSIISLTDGINHNLLAVDSLNNSIMDGNASLDIRAMAYLKEMERHSKERLQKYHYYMAKGYEYRLLTAYPGELNLDSIFNKFVSLAQIKIDDPTGAQGNVTKVISGQDLTAAEFNELKPLFENQISTIAADILDRFNSSAPPQTTTITYDLTPADLKLLNLKQSVPLNLVERGRIVKAAENLRIVDLKIKNITAHPVGGTISQWAEFDIVMEHSGRSKLSSNGKIYQFDHYSNSTTNPMTWVGTYDMKATNLTMHGLDPASAALIKSLVPSLTTGDQLLYTQPAVWSDINISMPTEFINTDNGIDFALDSLSLELTYNYTPKPSTLTYLNIKPSDNDLKPLFTVGSVDNNKRYDGWGDILRNYLKGTTVQITAPTAYGARNFVRWRDLAGTTLSTAPQMNVGLATDKIIFAEYTPPPPTIEVNKTGTGTGKITADNGTLIWNGNTGTENYLTGTTVVLTAAADFGSSFTGWIGCDVVSGNTCTVTMNTGKSVSATFNINIYPGASTGITALAGNTKAFVSFTAPEPNGTNAITGYTVTSFPLGGIDQDAGTLKTSHTITNLINETPYFFTVTARNIDGSGPASLSSNSVTPTATLRQLTVALNGTGGGNINSSPSGIACSSGICSSKYENGTKITLLETGNNYSVFGGWSGCVISDGNCMVTMDSNKSVTATFTAAPKIKVGSKTFTTIQASYDDPATSNDAVIRLLEGVLPGSLTANKDISVTLEGGNNAAYTASNSNTTISTPLVVKRGKILVRGVKVR